MIKVQPDDFDVGFETDELIGERTDIGAVVTFVGRVRDLHSDKSLSTMTLEHYPGMTEKMLAEIEAEARARWPIDDSLIIHRYGRLEPGDNIVLVITASAHRKAAFEANEFLMDWLKTKAPFWKQESSEDGDDWVEATTADDEAAARWATETT